MTRGLRPDGTLDWTYDGPPATHVRVQVGQGDALPLAHGSALLIGGAAQGIGGAAVRVTARTPDTVALHRAGSAYEDSAYGVRVPLHEVSSVTGDVIRVPMATLTPPQARFQFQLHGEPFTARVHGRDVLSVIGAAGPARLVLTAQTAQGPVTRTLDILIDDTPPTGSVSVAYAAGYAYLTYRDLSDDTVTLHLHYPDGAVLTATRAEGERGRRGVLGLEAPGVPDRVTARDDAGNESGNLLVRRTNLTPPGAGGTTPLAPWPLPSYLSAREPILGALLGAFTQALSIGADEAGSALDLRDADGRGLDALCAYYGVTRRPGESDPSLTARTRARFAAHKSTRAGLTRQLDEVDAGQVLVTDARSQYETARTLDGSWTLDGSVQLGGTGLTVALTPGEIMVRYDRTPLKGWDAARHVVRTRKAAGIIPQHRALQHVHAVLGLSARVSVHAAFTAAPAAPLAALTGLRYSGVLQLDGSWTLNGAETLDGTRDGQQVTPL